MPYIANFLTRVMEEIFSEWLKTTGYDLLHYQIKIYAVIICGRHR